MLVTFSPLYQLTSRVEDLEDMLATVHDYVEKVTTNDTQAPTIVDRSNPGTEWGWTLDNLSFPELQSYSEFQNVMGMVGGIFLICLFVQAIYF